MHYGGGLSDNGNPRNRFFPYFETLPEELSMKSYPKKALGGKDNGIELWLDAEVWQYYFPTKSESLGFDIGVTHPFDFEQSKLNGLAVRPGMISNFGISTYKIETDGQSFRRRIPMAKSKCYFDGEVVLDHFPPEYYRYSMTNCLKMRLCFKKQKDN